MADQFEQDVEAFFSALSVVLNNAGTDPVARLRAYRGLLVQHRLAGFGIPEAFGGRTDIPNGNRRFQELAHGRLPKEDTMLGIGLNMAVPIILQYGTEEQKKKFIPAALSAENIWCQLYSEPEAGSDLASLRTTAILDGDEWVVNGQKVWTSGAQLSDMGVLLARTGDAPRNRGISMLLIPLKQPGVDVRPLRQMTGEAEFNEVFFTNARVPRDWVIGEVNDGWRAATGLLAHERSSLGKVGADEKREASGSAAVPFHYLFDLVSDRSERASLTIRQDLARAYTGEKLMDWLGQRSVHPSVGKLWRTKQARFVASLAAQIILDGSLAYAPNDSQAKFWRYHILNSPRMSLGGGTDEIQKNTIGERALGLPREPS
ncbi:MAG: acyl-CoA dehydrogenase family protein [Ilumatobacteraceae bacterium]